LEISVQDSKLAFQLPSLGVGLEVINEDVTARMHEQRLAAAAHDRQDVAGDR